MSERAIELLLLPDEPCFLLDVGCGSGLSGSVLEDQGHFWVGMDISPSMLGRWITAYLNNNLIFIFLLLDVAVEREVEGDLLLSDMGQGCPFRAGTFDGAISISAIQWLCNADKSSHKPVQRLYKFFSLLYASLVSINEFVNQIKLNLIIFYRVEVQEQSFNFIQRMLTKWNWSLHKQWKLVFMEVL